MKIILLLQILWINGRRFLYWTVNHSVVTPSTNSNSITLHLMQNDTLIAHYQVLPHYPIEVLVDPPYAGTVKFGTNLSTSTDMVVEMQGALAIPFQAFDAEYWDFVGWETVATPILPTATSSTIGLYFMQPETVIAHFQRQIFSYYIPNSFTPNNDGVNDVFKIEGNAIDPSTFHLEIYNRWGEKIFETTDLSAAWEGDMKGGEYYVKDEIYAYRLKLKSVFDSDFKELTGTITVFR